MSKRRSKHVGFISFHKESVDEDGAAVFGSFALRQDLKGIEDWKRRHAEEAGNAKEHTWSSIEVGEGGEEDARSAVQSVAAMMRRFRRAMMAYHPLVGFIRVVPAQFETGILDARLGEFARQKLDLIDEDEMHRTYGFTAANASEVFKLTSEFSEFVAGFSVIPGSVMLSLVATFDSYFSEFVEFMLKQRRERYFSSEKSMTVKEILSMSSFDDVIQHVIDDEVYDLMRGSHADQVKFVEGQFNIKIREHYQRWPDFVEIFERRNLVAHGNCIVNARYMKNCGAAGRDLSKLRVGESLALTPAYLRRTTDTLTEFGLLLMLTVSRKQLSDVDEELGDEISEAAYRLIETKRHRLAARLLDFVLDKQSMKVTDSLKKRMIVNYANALRKSGSEKYKKVLDSTDWSATSDRYQICVAALRDDVDRFVELMPSVVRAGSIAAAEFKAWPVFDWVRADERVGREYERLFGEALVVVTDSERSQEQIPSTQDGGV